MKFLWPCIAGKKVKKLGEILAKALAAGKETDIAVNTAGTNVVIAGREMAVPSNAVGFLADDEAWQLRVR